MNMVSRHQRKPYLILIPGVLLALMLTACLPMENGDISGRPLVLQNFSAELTGKGTHGSVVCVRYPGRRADLESLGLQASLSRGGEMIEAGIPAETLEGDTCFELTDAKYVSVSSNPEGGALRISPDPLTLTLDALSPNGQPIENASQTLSVGPYVQFPFLRWIFPEGVRPACIADGHTRSGVFYPAWDIIPEPSESCPTIVSTPLLAPVDGTAYVWLLPNEDSSRRFDTVNALLFYSEDTGFAVDLTHAADLIFDGSRWTMLKLLNGQKVSAGALVGMIGPKDHASSIPHIHLQVFIPPELPTGRAKDNETLYKASTSISTANVDAIKQGLFLDPGLNETLLSLASQSLRCEDYPWGELVVPQQLALNVDGQGEDWAAYQPALSDKSGDSAAGETLDLRALYSAVDENYLYMMLEAGPQPEGKWAVDFFVDLKAKNACGSSERSIKIWSDQPDGFTVGSVDNCPDSSAQTYPALFVWGEVLEVRIPLAYLNNPDEPRALSVKGILVDAEGGMSYPDYMR